MSGAISGVPHIACAHAGYERLRDALAHAGYLRRHGRDKAPAVKTIA